MAEIKKYLDLVGAEHLVDLVKAEDVKVKEDANAYADSLAKNYDAAGSSATAETNAKEYTNQLVAGLETKGEAAKVQGKLDEEVQARKDADAALQSAIDGVSTVANKNKEDITAINHAETGILAVANKHTDDKIAEVQGNINALSDKVGEIPEGSTVMGIIENIQENAYDDTELRGLIFGLDANKADKTQVATDISTAVKAETDARIEAISGVQGEVNAIKDDYLKASDKEELEGKINLKADQSALDAVSSVANAASTKVELKAEENRAKGEETRIEGLVTAEVERATGVEADFKSRIEAMEVFWDTTEDADGVVNKLKEIQEYIASDETGAATMAGNIQKNTQDIAAMDEAYKSADSTLQENIDKLSGVVNGKVAQGDFEALEGRMDDAESAIDTVEGRLDVVEPKVVTLEGKMTSVEGAVATKAEAQDLTDAIATLNGVDADLDERLQLVEAQLGDGENSVSDLIADAKQEAIGAAANDATSKANKALEDAKKYADEEDAKIESRVGVLEGASATHATKTELEGVAGRVTTVEGKVSTLESEMDAVEKKASDNESAIGTISTELTKKATQTGLEAAVARISANETEIAKKANDSDLDDATARITKNEEDIAKHTSEIAALQSSVTSFVRIENSEIEALFA